MDKIINLKPEPIEITSKQDRRSWWVTLFLLCAILGAMLALSVRTQQVIKNIPAATSSTISKTEVDGLQRTIKTLQGQNADLVKAISTGDGQKALLGKGLKAANFLAGLTAVSGPGVEVVLNDSKLPYPNAIPGMTPPNIIHDTDINQVVNELKAAGAEAVSVNDQRLVAVSAIRCAGPTIFVNNTAQTPPYLIKAIGEPKTLEAALNLPGGLASIIKSYDKAMFQVGPSKRLTIPAYSGVIPSKYAVPVADKTAGA